MKFMQVLALLGSVCFGIGGLSSAASAAPLAGAQALGAAHSGSLVITVRDGQNADIAIGIAGALLGVQKDSDDDDDDGPAVGVRTNRQPADDDEGDDDDDGGGRLRCRHGAYVDYRGMLRCRP